MCNAKRRQKKRRKAAFGQGDNSSSDNSTSDEDFVLDDFEDDYEDDDEEEDVPSDQLVTTEDDADESSKRHRNRNRNRNCNPKPKTKPSSKGAPKRIKRFTRARKNIPRKRARMSDTMSDDEDYHPDSTSVSASSTSQGDGDDDDEDISEVLSEYKQPRKSKARILVRKNNKRKVIPPSSMNLSTKRRKTSAPSLRSVPSYANLQKKRKPKPKPEIESDPDFTCSHSGSDFSISDQSDTLVSEIKPSDKRLHNFFGKRDANNNSINNHNKKSNDRNRGEAAKSSNNSNTNNNVVKPFCGICLSDDGKASRGKLDSCMHYFCFACIMEWAKVESKCPMCKKRFGTITKSSKCLNSGKGLRGTIIKIPVRDQVYQPSEEEVLGFLDPYASVACLECNQSGDDELLLLCDLCDSAHHTYCVGLGRTVPEGDWYCQACQMSIPSEPDISDDGINDFVLDLDNANEVVNHAESAGEAQQTQRRAIFDLNLPPPSPTLFDSIADRSAPLRRIRRRAFQQSLPNYQRLSDSNRNSFRSTEAITSPSPVSNSGARTLSGQRRLQEHVHALRDAWTAPERVSPLFNNSITPGISFGTRNGHHVNSNALISTDCQENLAFPSRRAESQVTDQIWEQIDHSRSLELQTESPPMSHREGCKQDESRYKRVHTSAASQSRDHNEKDIPTCVFPWVQNSDVVEPLVCNSILHPTVPEGNDFRIKSESLNNQQSSQTVEHSQDQLNNIIFPNPKNDVNDVQKHDGAKEKVLAMVKSILKGRLHWRSSDKDTFKEIARWSTHTILAACGLEHSHSKVISFEKVLCPDFHDQKTSLMDGCCSDCFNSFVEKIVGKITEQKIKN